MYPWHVRKRVRMDHYLSCTRAYFNQIHSKQCSEIKDIVSCMLINKARLALKSEPFGFNDQISGEVAQGIILYGDKLISNSENDCEDDEEVKELNQLGQYIKNTVSVALLEVTIPVCTDDCENYMTSVYNLYPYPLSKKHCFEYKAVCVGECLSVIESFIGREAKKGFVAAIVLKTSHGETGVKFPRDCEVPINVFEDHIRHFLVGQRDWLLPMAVHLIIPGDGQISVLNVTANAEKEVKRYTVNSIDGVF